MKKIIDKIRVWYRGERVVDYMNLGPSGLPAVWYNKSTSAKIATWLIENWKILLPVFATLTCAIIAAGVSLFIHFDNKSKRETSQKQVTPPKQVGAESAQRSIGFNQPTSNRKAKHSRSIPLKTVKPAVKSTASVPSETNQPNKQSGDNLTASDNGIVIKQERNGTINIGR